MEVKCLEVRDRATFMPVICIRPTPYNEAQRWLLQCDGYRGDNSENCIILINTQCRGVSYDPYGWPAGSARTIPYAHKYISENWFTLNDGDVVDVEYIYFGSEKPKHSQRDSTLCGND